MDSEKISVPKVCPISFVALKKSEKIAMFRRMRYPQDYIGGVWAIGRWAFSLFWQLIRQKHDWITPFVDVTHHNVEEGKGSVIVDIGWPTHCAFFLRSIKTCKHLAAEKRSCFCQVGIFGRTWKNCQLKNQIEHKFFKQWSQGVNKRWGMSLFQHGINKDSNDCAKSNIKLEHCWLGTC